MNLAGLQLDLSAPLGRGGMGAVYAAVHPQVGQVVVKRLPGVAADRRVELVDEIRTTAALDHPHVVRIHDVGVLDAADAARLGWAAGDAWVAMDRSHGTLRDLALHDWRDVRGVLRPLLGALAHAHARGVVHLDVKPANVLLGGPTRAGPWLADFGIARVLGQGPGERRGTPAYMPPEQRAGRWRDLGPWSDLYALGRTALAVWTGSGHTPVGDLDIPPALAAWLGRLVEPDLRFRWRHAAQALAAMPTEEARPIPVAPAPLAATAVAATATVALDGPADRTGSPVPVLDPCLPLPVDWRTPQDRTTVPGIVGAGLVQVREPPFVGRTAERDRLWAATSAAFTAGRSATIRLDGPPGIGVSRLAAWLAETVGAADAAVVVQARCTPLPLAGLATAARVHHGAMDLAGPALTARVPAIAAWLDGGLPTGARRAAAAGWIADLAARGPVLCVLDDADQDPEVPALLTHLAATHDGPPIVTVVARADVPADVDVDVGPLPEVDHRTLVGALLAHRPALARDVGARTAGHPGSVVALVRALAAGNTGDGTPSEVARDRLAALPAPLRDALAVGACLGPVVARPLWVRAIGDAPDLGPAVRTGLVRLTPGGWSFASRALADAALADASPAAVQAAVAVLDDAPAAALLERTGHPGATDRWLAAATRAHDDADWAGAQRAVTRALALLDRADPRHVHALTVELGAARRLLDRHTTRGLAEAALVTYPDPPPALRVATAALLAYGGDHARAEALLDGLDTPDPEGLRIRGGIAERDGDLAGALAHLDAAIALAERTGAPGAALRFANRRAIVLLNGGRGPEALAALERVAPAARTTPGADPAESLRWLALLRQLTGDAEGALDAAVEAHAIASRNGILPTAAYAESVQADALRSLGRLDEAEAHYRRVGRLMDAVGVVEAWVNNINLAQVLLARQDWAGAAAIADDVADRVDALDPALGALPLVVHLECLAHTAPEACGPVLDALEAIAASHPLTDKDLADPAGRAAHALAAAHPALAARAAAYARTQYTHMGATAAAAALP